MKDLLETQLEYVPIVEGKQVQAATIVCGGMGGSAFPALFLRFLDATPYVIIHREYGLPERVPEHAQYIAISYSGNTAETLSFAQEAFDKGLPLSVVAGGGALLAFAKEHGLSHVELPTGVVPRDGIIVLSKALLALIGEERLFGVHHDAPAFDIERAEREGKSLGKALENSIPIIYASERNMLLSSFAKILFNETAKAPAFANVFPELDHNELQEFDSGPHASTLTAPFMTLFLRDDADDDRIQRRMDVTEQLIAGKGTRTAQIAVSHDTRTGVFLYTWWLMRTAAYHLAAHYGVDPNATPFIDSLKASLANDSRQPS